MLDNDIYEMKVEQAKKRIRDAYKQTGGDIYLSFSGGKDSTIILSLIKELGYNIPAVYSDTGIELKAIKDFVKWVKCNYYSSIVIIKPKKTYNQVIKKGKPFRSKMKSVALNYYQKNPFSKTALSLYDKTHCTSHRLALANKDFHILHHDFNIKISNDCCETLKKAPFKDFVNEYNLKGVLLGTRQDEGGMRAFQADKRQAKTNNICTVIKKDGFIQKSPIIDWSDEMCETYIAKNNIPLSRAYTEYGMTRTGCYLCPFDRDLKKRLEILYKYEPNTYKAALYFMSDIYIAQGVKLEFDAKYMVEYNKMWENYTKMRYEMLLKYRPNCNIVKKGI